MESIFSKKLFEYADRFGENFPTFYYRYSTEAEIIAIIDDCLKNDKPIKIEDSDPEILI